MNKICTSIEQSKKLMELGIDVNTSDMYWSIEEIPYMPFPVNDIVTDWDYAQENGMLPAWSLSALLEFMPFQLIKNNNRYGFYQVKGFNKQGETYRFGYKSNDNSFLYETSWYNDPIDAAFEMISKLHELKTL